MIKITHYNSKIKYIEIDIFNIRCNDIKSEFMVVYLLNIIIIYQD